MIRVLVVDDSAVVRKVLTEELSKQNDIEVVGSAIDPFVARDKILRLQPDVITLDIEMPRMDGLTFLEKLMRQHPLPVVVVSSVTPKNAQAALRALRMGAVEVLAKPDSPFSTPDSRYLAQVIRAAAGARLRELPRAEEKAGDSPPHRGLPNHLETTHKILALGASTGGTNTLEAILRTLPPTTPGTVVVQHMPKVFTRMYAERLDGVCAMRVREACEGDPVAPGVVLVAPGDQHMVVRRSGAQYRVHIRDGPKIHFQRPSVDVLFYSIARNAGRNAVGVILTGMGRDGAGGLLEMKKNGALTIAQDEATSVVFGMPKEAIKVGAAERVVRLPEIAETIMQAFSRQASQTAVERVSAGGVLANKVTRLGAD